MLIDDIVNFCHQEAQRNHCEGCEQQHKCIGDCKQCLDDIHFHKNKIRKDYDCERLLDYYVCRYSYKYCSEMIYALEQLDLKQYPYFHILSLGCGGAADLMAFEYMKYEQPLSYIGLDRNPFWQKIHKEIETRFSSGKAKLHCNVDVLDFFDENHIGKCNVLIIEYLISFFYSSIGISGMKKWFRKLVEKVIQYKPKDSPLLVIINDVDSINTGRDTFLMLKNIIEECNLSVSFERRMRFKSAAYYPYSIQYSSKANKFEIPQEIKDNYCPAITCESAQLILEVE